MRVVQGAPARLEGANEEPCCLLMVLTDLCRCRKRWVGGRDEWTEGWMDVREMDGEHVQPGLRILSHTQHTEATGLTQL